MSTKQTKELLVENMHNLVKNMDKCLDKHVLKVMKENEPKADFLSNLFSTVLDHDSLSVDDYCRHLNELNHGLNLAINHDKKYSDKNLTGEKDVVIMCDIIGGYPNLNLSDNLVACAREVVRNAQIDLQLYLHEEDVKNGAMMTFAKVLEGAIRTMKKYDIELGELNYLSTTYLRGWVYNKYFEARGTLGKNPDNSYQEDGDTMLEDISRLMMCSEMARKYGDNYEIIDLDEYRQHHRPEELAFHPNGNCGSLFCGGDKYIFGIRCLHLIWTEGNCEGQEDFWNKGDYLGAEIRDFSDIYNAILINGNHKGELKTKLLVFHEK